MTNDISDALDRALAGRMLLDHPFYRRWQDGLLTRGDLASYAEQYRHVEQRLPDVLATTAGRIGDAAARRLVEDNLRDECSRPCSHVELFERFAAAVGARRHSEPSAATQRLVDVYQRAAATDGASALAVIGAYESQAADVAATKAASLRAHYHLGPVATAFWDVHAGLEDTHAAWTAEALHRIEASPAHVEQFARLSADVWWAFLDERDEQARRN